MRNHRAIVPWIAALMALAAACAPVPEGRDFRVESASAYPVVLHDETGLVTGVEWGPEDSAFTYGEPAIHADPADPKAFIVTWLSGPAKDAKLVLSRHDDGYLLRLEVHGRGGFGGGTGVGVIGTVRVHTSEAIPPESILAGGSAAS